MYNPVVFKSIIQVYHFLWIFFGLFELSNQIDIFEDFPIIEILSLEV